MKKIVPVLREESKHLFAEDARLKHVTQVDGHSVETGFLKPDQVVDVIGLSQSAWVLSGLVDQRDALYPEVSLESLALQFGEDIIVLNMAPLRSAKFTSSPAGDHQRLELNGMTYGMLLLGGYRDAAREELKTLTELVDGSIDPTLHISVMASINIETGELALHSKILPFDEIPGQPELNAKLAAGTVVGYTILAHLAEEVAVCVDDSHDEAGPA